MDEDFEPVWIETSIPSRKFRRVDMLVIGFTLLQDISNAVGTAFSTAAQLAAEHANYQYDRETFHEEAALEIETLTQEESDG